MTIHPDASLASHPLNCVQDHLSKAKSKLLLKDVPSLPPALLKRARNCVVRSCNNNDLLEFIGDRAVNLFAAIMVGGVKLNKAHHSAVRRTVCNNDTLGRISYHLRFHHDAEFDKQDSVDIDKWTSFSADHPPKVLADLFESYVGAVYTHHGWAKLYNWLEKLFVPIVKAATGDYWLSVSPEQLLGTCRSTRHKSAVPETRFQGKLLDYVEYKRDTLKSSAWRALDVSSKTTDYKFDRQSGSLQETDLDKVEVAVHLINMWICQIVVDYRPEYHMARAKAAYLLTAITGLVTSERVVAYLSTLLELDASFEVADVTSTLHGGGSSESDSELGGSLQTQAHRIAWRPLTPAQRAILLKAAIGWGYHKNPAVTMTWGVTWFKSIVIRAHDILVDFGGPPILSMSSTTPQDDSSVSVLSSLLSDTLHIEGDNTREKSTSAPLLSIFDEAAAKPKLPSFVKPEKGPSHPSKIHIMVHSEAAKDTRIAGNVSLDHLAKELSSLSLDLNKPVIQPEEKAAMKTPKTAISTPTTEAQQSGSEGQRVSEKWRPITRSTDSEQRYGDASNECAAALATTVSSSVLGVTTPLKSSIPDGDTTPLHPQPTKVSALRPDTSSVNLPKTQKAGHISFTASVDSASVTAFVPRSVRIKVVKSPSPSSTLAPVVC